MEYTQEDLEWVVDEIIYNNGTNLTYEEFVREFKFYCSEAYIQISVIDEAYEIYLEKSY